VVQAHTQQIGAHTQSELRRNVARWTQIGYFPADEISYDDYHVVNTAYSVKPAPVQGDRKSPQYYNRRIYRMLRDEPEKFTEVVYRDPYEPYALIREVQRYISVVYKPMALDIPMRFITDLKEREREANVAALNRLRDGKLQNGADLAEARKTVMMIAQDCRRVLTAYRAIRLGNFAFAAKVLGLNLRKGRHGTPADLWLELQYGWKPLIQAIHENAQTLAKPRQKNRLEVKASATRRATFESQRTTSEGFVETWKCIGETRVVYKGIIQNEGLVAADTYGLLNPAEIAWELIPFSFVIDWFIPIGNMLSSLSASAGLAFAEGYRSTRYTAVFTSSRNGGLMEVAHFNFDRVPFTQFELPDLYGKSNPFSTPHVLNALALIFQNL